MHREDSDMTALMRRLIQVSAGRTCPKVGVLAWRLICIVFVSGE